MRKLERVMKGVYQISNTKPLTENELTERRKRMRAEFEAWKETVNANHTGRCQVPMDVGGNRNVHSAVSTR